MNRNYYISTFISNLFILSGDEIIIDLWLYNKKREKDERRRNIMWFLFWNNKGLPEILAIGGAIILFIFLFFPDKFLHNYIELILIIKMISIFNVLILTIIQIRIMLIEKSEEKIKILSEKNKLAGVANE